MKKFMVLYMMPQAAMAEMMQNSTPEQRKASMDEWGAWMEGHKADFADMGALFGKNMRVTKGGGAMAPNDIGGYSIMQAESQEEVAKMLADNPSFNMPGSFVEVMELMPM